MGFNLHLAGMLLVLRSTLCTFDLIRFPLYILGCISANAITSNSAVVKTVEDFTITLSCNYSSGNYLQWYRQYPRSEPQFLMSVYSSTEAQKPSSDPRLSGILNKEKTQIFLNINSAKLSDSAVYYCAMEPTVKQTDCLSYKKH